MMVRYGIVGVGNWTRGTHLPNLLRVEDARISALCSRSEANRRAGAEMCPEPPLLFEKWEELLACDEVDAAIICTPNVLHAQQAAEALRVGKHVLCEKPVVLERQQAEELATAVRESDAIFAAGYELRSADVVRVARDAIERGDLGELLMVTVRFWRRWGPMDSGWRGDPSVSGGIIHELYSHTADLHKCLIGEVPEKICARGAAVKGPPYWDRMVVSADYPGGIMSVGEVCLQATGAPENYPFRICGTEGRLEGDIVTGQLNLFQGADVEDLSPRRDGEPINGFPGSLELVDEFTECVLGRRERPRAGLEEALGTFGTCLAIEQSLAKDRPFCPSDELP
ncbi:MAG: Gfo/Idh/MocA family protein [Candidatus Brocadiia bacterium]